MTEKLEEWQNRAILHLREKRNYGSIIITQDPACLDCYPITNISPEFTKFWKLYQEHYVTAAVCYNENTQSAFDEIRSINGEILVEGFVMSERRLESLIESIRYEDTLY